MIWIVADTFKKKLSTPITLSNVTKLLFKKASLITKAHIWYMKHQRYSCLLSFIDLPLTIQSCFERWVEPKRIVNRRRDTACRIKHRRTRRERIGGMVEEWRGQGPARGWQKGEARLGGSAGRRDEDKHNSELSREAVPSLTYFTLERGFYPPGEEEKVEAVGAPRTPRRVFLFHTLLLKYVQRRYTLIYWWIGW